MDGSTSASRQQRWDIADISLDSWVNDVAAVVDAASLDRFALLGYSQGCAVSIAYAVQHPERVSHLILYGGFALGASKRAPEESERRKALVTLMRLEWGADNPAIRQMFAARLMPDATKVQVDTSMICSEKPLRQNVRRAILRPPAISTSSDFCPRSRSQP
jgi:pimeloyl-ACP methyl ester carboxylesterase